MTTTRKPVARTRAKRRVMDASKFIAIREFDADHPERGWYTAVNGYALPARANQKLHWTQIKAQRELGHCIASTLPGFPLPCTITLTRVSPGKLDSHDGLGMAFKAIVDGIADVLVGKAVTITRNGRKVTVIRGDDSDPRITWQYRQERGEYAIKAEVTLRKTDATPCECGHARRDHNADHPCLVDGCRCTNYNPPEVTRG